MSDLDDLDDDVLEIVLGFQTISEGIELLARSGAITDTALNATLTVRTEPLQQVKQFCAITNTFSLHRRSSSTSASSWLRWLLVPAPFSTARAPG